MAQLNESSFQYIPTMMDQSLQNAHPIMRQMANDDSDVIGEENSQDLSSSMDGSMCAQNLNIHVQPQSTALQMNTAMVVSRQENI